MFDPLSLKYDAAGLIPAIAQSRDGEVLMLAWMNAEAVARTLGACDILVNTAAVLRPGGLWSATGDVAIAGALAPLIFGGSLFGPLDPALGAHVVRVPQS